MLAVVLLMLLGDFLFWYPAIARAPASAPSDDTGTPENPAAGSDVARAVAVEPADDESGSEDRDETENEEPVLGRLRITADAPATVQVDDDDLGLLEPGDELLHDLHQRVGKIRAESQEVSAAIVEEAYEIDDASPNAGASVPEIEISLKIAKAVREARKKERRDGVYADFKHGVMWRRQDNSKDVTWSAAMRHCEDLEYGGWSDWRLPTIEELDALQAIWSRAAFKTIDPIRLSDCCPWSSSEIDEAEAWNYNFRFRRPFEGQKGFSYGLRALCVRTLTPEELADRDKALAERKEKKKREKKEKTDDEKGVVGTVDEVSGTEPPAAPLEPPGR
jgi:hypothetical protein